MENEDNESGISSTGYDSDGSHSQVSLPESIDSSQGDNKSHEASTEWELEQRQREECSDYKEMGERVLMWGEDSYDDTLTAKQESQETRVDTNPPTREESPQSCRSSRGCSSQRHAPLCPRGYNPSED